MLFNILKSPKIIYSLKMAKNKSGHRNSATTRRLKMYNCRPKRDRKGKILKHKYQSKQLPSTRIQLDPRWFINTRVISQEKSESFREEIQDRLSSNYNIIMNGSNLPMSLVNEHKKKGKVHQLDDSKPSAGSKKNHANHFKSLAKKADTP